MNSKGKSVFVFEITSGGGAGGTAIFNGAAGADGAGGMFRVYYGSDYS